MTKAARLLELLTLLGARRYPVSGVILADALGVSLRTIYRDIDTLRRSGADIEGEAGLGYILSRTAHIPPLNFGEDEIYALLTGIEMVVAFTDDDLAACANSAREKIVNVLDDRRKGIAENLPYRAPTVFLDHAARARHAIIRTAIVDRSKLDISYHALDDTLSARTIWPLGLIAWFGKWTLTAWCETRDDYRNFRTDRITDLRPNGANFTPSVERSLRHFLRNRVSLCDDNNPK